jgi:hypothetical protein
MSRFKRRSDGNSPPVPYLAAPRMPACPRPNSPAHHGVLLLELLAVLLILQRSRVIGRAREIGVSDSRRIILRRIRQAHLSARLQCGNLVDRLVAQRKHFLQRLLPRLIAERPARQRSVKPAVLFLRAELCPWSA